MGNIRIPVSESIYAIEAFDYPADLPEGDIEHLMQVLCEVADERYHQDKRWGGPAHDDTHTPYEWEGLLHERIYHLTDCVGEAQVRYRRALVESAAIAVAALQAWDRAHPATDIEEG